MPWPTIAVPYDPNIANPSFFQAMQRFGELKYNVLLLDCRYFNEEHLELLVQENIKLIDGLLLPGSSVDIHPKFYNETVKNHLVAIAQDDRLMNYQTKMIVAARNRGLPVLGICMGSHLINVIYGGKIDQDITRNEAPKVQHDIDPRSGKVAHKVNVSKGTHLHDILSGNTPSEEDLTLDVNSWHHTASINIPDSLAVSCQADDGVVEGLEEKFPGHPNLWGIQFHPEYLKESESPIEYQRQLRILNAFRTACLSQHVKKEAAPLLMQFDLSTLKKSETRVLDTPTKRVTYDYK